MASWQSDRHTRRRWMDGSTANRFEIRMCYLVWRAFYSRFPARAAWATFRPYARPRSEAVQMANVTNLHGQLGYCSVAKSKQLARCSYARERAGRFDRPQRRVADLNRQLGGDGWGTSNNPPIKPKWMRWRTYKRRYEPWGANGRANPPRVDDPGWPAAEAAPSNTLIGCSDDRYDRSGHNGGFNGSPSSSRGV
jgi:hypothetical protein